MCGMGISKGDLDPGRFIIRQSQPIDCPTKSAIFKCDACGHSFVILVAEFELREQEAAKVSLADVAGVDVGLNNFLTPLERKRDR
jgi:hypothetical protein